MRQLITKMLEPKDNAPEAAFLLIELLNAKISHSTIEKEVKEHPDYPSFLSISDVLNNYKIENIVARFDKGKLVDLPAPFITQIRNNRNNYQYTVVKEIDQQSVHFFDPEKQKWDKTKTEDFLDKTNSVVLLAESEEVITEKDYKNKIREERRIRASQYLTALSIPVILFISFLFAFSESGPAVFLPMLFSTLTLIGAFVTTLLLWYEIDQHNTVLQQICSAGKKINCGAILQSKDARIFGISWSVIGFVYFMGSLIALLTLGITNPVLLKILSFLNAVAVPYIFYSIYYQWKIAKQWCVLCLAVQCVLALQCIVTITAGWHLISIDNDMLVKQLIQILTAFSIPFIVSGLLIPALRKAKHSGNISMELQRFKHNPTIFNALLEKQKSIQEYPEGLGIIMGNPNATHKIIKVCNPYCGPCANAHTPMEDLLANNPDLQLQIIFTASNTPDDVRAHPVRHLLAINDKSDEKLMHQALGDWYLAEKKEYQVFSEKYPMNGELVKQGDKIDAMRKWCDKTEIQFTPTFFVNGYQLPSNYSVSDLKYFLSV